MSYICAHEQYKNKIGVFFFVVVLVWMMEITEKDSGTFINKTSIIWITVDTLNCCKYMMKSHGNELFVSENHGKVLWVRVGILV